MVRAGLTLSLCLLAAPASACRLALVLAMDVSSSVDPAEDQLQRGGLAAALSSAEVEAAFLSSSDPVAITVFEWSGRGHQSDLIDWTFITSAADLRAVSDRIALSSRVATKLPTALGHALAYASQKLINGPNCLFQTIDVAGDGINNDGFGAQITYATFPFEGVTVNGLAISGENNDMVAYYENEVIRGPGSFVEEADSFAAFEDAMRRKLVRELTAIVTGDASTTEEANG